VTPDNRVSVKRGGIDLKLLAQEQNAAVMKFL
jgi:hypothetical protein